MSRRLNVNIIFAILVVLSLLLNSSLLLAKNIYLSPSGNDSSKGLTIEAPLKTFNAAFKIVEPGDEIRLLPGVYFKKTSFVMNVHGGFDNPIIIRSHREDPAQYAIIDGGAKPRIQGYGMKVNNSSWLVFKDLKFRNCWQDVIDIDHSSYLSFIGCYFEGGRRVIYPQFEDCHHFLVEDCYWEQDEKIYTDYDWAEMHHGSMKYLNGSLFAGKSIGGGVVIRDNIIKNAYNGIRFTGERDDRRQNANYEIYNNKIINTGDNAFEPEYVCYNVHFYHNQLENSHAYISIDMVRGGEIYFYGNRGWQSTHAGHEWTIFKFRGYDDEDGPQPLDEPFYVFNNSWYVHFDAISGSSSGYRNRYMKHYNNAYYFTGDNDLIGVKRLGKGCEFDYDCSNNEFPDLIDKLGFEKHGIESDPLFQNPARGDFRVGPQSPCIDAGRKMSFDEFDWTQNYKGQAPDIGAFENNRLVDGPPFRFREPPGGAYYEENPRIVRHYVKNNVLKIYFSTPLDTSNFFSNSLNLYHNSQKLDIQSIDFADKGYLMEVRVDESIDKASLKIYFDPLPAGTNEQLFTHWASTIAVKKGIPR
jgi:hypothetical protein